MIVGMLVLGYVGDILGRRRAMAITITIMMFGAFGSCLLTWGDETAVYVLVSVFRFVTGIGIGGVRKRQHFQYDKQAMAWTADASN